MAATPPSSAAPAASGAAHEPPAVIDEFVRRAYLMREWVGPEVELAFDFHGKMTPALAIEICHELKGMRPMFVEEPVPQENVDALKLVADHVPFPIATGERLLTPLGVPPGASRSRPRAYLQPDGSHAGGISELKKIANMAEVYYMHIDAALRDRPGGVGGLPAGGRGGPQLPDPGEPGRSSSSGPVQLAWTAQGRLHRAADAPGLGVEVDEQESARMSAYTEELGGEYFYESDGSVADWSCVRFVRSAFDALA